MDADPVFVDTNVLVYARVREAPLHKRAVEKLEDLHSAGSALWLSRQVLREYLATLSRPQTFSAPVSAAALRTDVDRLQLRFHLADETHEVTKNLLTLLDSFAVGGKQVHDANVVATMQACGVRRLLTHNTADFARYRSLIEVTALASE